MPAGRPFQWGGEGDAFSINEYNGYRLFTRVAASPDGTINTLITPWMLLGEGRNRFILDLNIYIWSRLGNTPYNEWNENAFSKYKSVKMELILNQFVHIIKTMLHN